MIHLQKLTESGGNMLSPFKLPSVLLTPERKLSCDGHNLMQEQGVGTHELRILHGWMLATLPHTVT